MSLAFMFAVVNSFAFYVDDVKYANLERTIDTVVGRLQTLEDFIKNQNDVIESQNERIALLEETVRKQTVFNLLRGLDTPGIFHRHVYKGDKLCDFLFAFLHIKHLLKRDQI